MKDKVVLITGASRGIGHAIAERFISPEFKIVGTSTSDSGADEIGRDLRSYGEGMTLDVSDLSAVKSCIMYLEEKFGGIDILVNNAGIRRDKLVVSMEEDDWRDVVETNLMSVFTLSRMAVRSMIKRRYGRIISIGSTAGFTGNPGQASYSAAKAGIVGFSRSLALEVASRGITVNVVSPGPVESDMITSLSLEQRSSMLAKIPIGRFGRAEEIAEVVFFLASDKAAYITGETVHVNGGMYMS